MGVERVLIFQPEDISSYARQSGPEEFLEKVLVRFELELIGQFRLFPYALSEVKRFLLNLDRQAFDRVIIPYLEKRGFKESQIKVEKLIEQ